MKPLHWLSLKTLSAMLLGAISLSAQAVVYQAENYNAFYDTTPGNSGGAYRGDAVDIEATSDSGGGYNVGWIDATEWLVYSNLSIPTSGNYTIRMRVASPNNGASTSMDLNGGAIVLGTVNIPNTGGWQNWQTVSINANINAGTYNLGVYARTAGWNLNWIEVVPSTTQTTGGVVKTYQHCDYGGWSAGLDVGNYNAAALQARGFINDDASSLKVAPGYEAVLYADDNFTGSSTTVRSDDSCLVNRGFNDVVTSIIVRPAAGVAKTYQHCDYGGWAANLDVGNYNLATLQARGFVNNDASSIKVAAGYEAVLYQDDNFGGASTIVKGDTNCLVSRGFNDNISSLIVRKATTTKTPTWSDEFDGINTNSWSFETGGGGWGNSELQYYTNGNNAYIQYDNQAGSNVLVLEARRENPANYGCWYGRCEYTSTRMVTRGKKSFKYGRMEARIKLPQTQGIWPAFWMLGDSFSSVGWPQGGEIDIMEHVGFEPNLTHGAMHGPGYSGATPITGTANIGQNVSSNYHVYAVEWDTNGVRWYVDGNQFYSASKTQIQQYGQWVFDQPFWFLLNVAVGGSWPGNPDGSSNFPQRMYVDYMRVYQ